MTELAPIPVNIRSYRPDDAQICRKLYLDGMIAGRIADNDTGMDIDNIESAYMKSEGSHFWVSENLAGEVVGMIGVQQHESSMGEIRRLRVRADHRRRGIGGQLIETAVRFCRDRHYLKVTLDTFMERDPAIKLFEKFQFRFHRERDVGDKTLLFFYLDLYQGQSKPKEE